MRGIFQFKITLLNIKPTIWRRIQIANSSSFWDLHVAIQDAMGWFDSHLHEFTLRNPLINEEDHIGIPDEDDRLFDHAVLAGWDHKVAKYIKLKQNKSFKYEYDFGDGWEHLIEFEGEFEKQKLKYPICMDGARACPPEDVGGDFGYENFLKAIQDPKHKEHEFYLDWVGKKFDPEYFDPKNVVFDNPKARLKLILA